MRLNFSNQALAVVYPDEPIQTTCSEATTLTTGDMPTTDSHSTTNPNEIKRWTSRSTIPAPTKVVLPGDSMFEMLPADLITLLFESYGIPITRLLRLNHYLNYVLRPHFTRLFRSHIARDMNAMKMRFLRYHRRPENKTENKSALAEFAPICNSDPQVLILFMLNFPGAKEDVFEALAGLKPYEALSQQSRSALFDVIKVDQELFLNLCIKAADRIDSVNHFLAQVPKPVLAVALAHIVTGVDYDWEPIVLADEAMRAVAGNLVRALMQGDSMSEVVVEIITKVPPKPSINALLTCHAELSSLLVNPKKVAKGGARNSITPFLATMMRCIESNHSLSVANYYVDIASGNTRVVHGSGDERLLLDDAFCERHEITRTDRINLLKRTMPEVLISHITSPAQFTEEVRAVFKGLNVNPDSLVSAHDGLFIAAITKDLVKFSKFSELDDKFATSVFAGKNLIGQLLSMPERGQVAGKYLAMKDAMATSD
jgi:hypothetical protein